MELGKGKGGNDTTLCAHSNKIPKVKITKKASEKITTKIVRPPLIIDSSWE